MGGSNSTGRGKGKTPRVMTPVEEVDISAVRYKSPTLQAPHLTGFPLRAFLWLMESPLLGSLITSVLKSQNNMPQMLQQTVIPERPMYYPDYPPQDPEPGVVLVGEDRHPVERVHEALQYLPPYDPSVRWASEEKLPFLYWKIRDFAHAYRSGITTPSIVAEHVIAGVEEWNNKKHARRSSPCARGDHAQHGRPRHSGRVDRRRQHVAAQYHHRTAQATRPACLASTSDHAVTEGEPVEEFGGQYCEPEPEGPFEQEPQDPNQELPEHFEDEEDPDYVAEEFE